MTMNVCLNVLLRCVDMYVIVGIWLDSDKLTASNKIKQRHTTYKLVCSVDIKLAPALAKAGSRLHCICMPPRHGRSQHIEQVLHWKAVASPNPLVIGQAHRSLPPAPRSKVVRTTNQNQLFPSMKKNDRRQQKWSMKTFRNIGALRTFVNGWKCCVPYVANCCMHYLCVVWRVGLMPHILYLCMGFLLSLWMASASSSFILPPPLLPTPAHLTPTPLIATHYTHSLALTHLDSLTETHLLHWFTCTHSPHTCTLALTCVRGGRFCWCTVVSLGCRSLLTHWLHSLTLSSIHSLVHVLLRVYAHRHRPCLFFPPLCVHSSILNFTCGLSSPLNK